MGKSDLAMGLALVCFLSGVVSGTPAGIDRPVPVVIDYFYEANCAACEEVRETVLPELAQRYGGFYQLRRHDVGVTSNMIQLLAYEDAVGVTNNSSVSMFIDYSKALYGIEAIRRHLFALMDESLNERMSPEWVRPHPITWSRQDAVVHVRDRTGTFTVPAVIAAGLLDGFNPCAISTLVFFMSLLIVTGVRGRGLLLMGSSFCLASFVVYTAIGFGLLHSLHLLDAFPTARVAFEACLAVVLLFLAFFSFRDAMRYRRSGDPGQVSLQLPERLKAWSRSRLRRGVRSHHLLGAGLALGAAVTAIETVCTGQVYVPAMTLVIREDGDRRVLALLLLYNSMFVVPLVIALMLTRYGLTTETMLRWSRKNVVVSKTLMGAFFVVVAVYLVVG